jgi:hypothetical protein
MLNTKLLQYNPAKLVEYDPIMDVYYIPSKSNLKTQEKYQVFQSRNILDKKGYLKWFCHCKDWDLNKKQGEKGDCRHIMLAKFYKNNEWARKLMIIRY